MSVSTCITITPINGVDQRRAELVFAQRRAGLFFYDLWVSDGTAEGTQRLTTAAWNSRRRWSMARPAQ